MSERPNYESFNDLRLAQQELERLGYFLHPIPKEHTEGAITNPLAHRLRTQIKRRGLEKLAGRTIITFSGFAEDPREVIVIPEIRAYWRQLDAQVPELPALVAYLPEWGFNGPGLHLMLLGRIDEAVARPALGGYDVLVAEADAVVADALRRIHQASATHRLRAITTQRLIANFVAGATYRFPRP
jgi:hypothetical protein